MFDNLSNLGYGIIGFAIVIGIGSIVLYNFAGATGCSDATVSEWNSTTNLCQEPTNLSNTASGSGASYTTSTYLLGQLGTTGLAGWTPAIIALSVGMLFLGAFFVGKGRRY